jgi:NIMA (never in mitosis gene a)-related kinase 1/4/5
MKGLIQKILKGTYPPLPEVYSPDLKKLLSEMLIKDPNKRPSIKKILEMPFMKAKINELFSSTIKIHELKLEK